MKDPIERQDAIDAFDCTDELIVSGIANAQNVVDYINKVVGKIKTLPSAQPAQRWIPCSERLPEEGETVLCTHLGGLNPNRQVIAHIYQDGKFTVGWDMDTDMRSPTFGQRYMGEVIAWMPLPEPYAERR